MTMSKKVCIEIGHRSPDTGAVSVIGGQTIRESDINLVVGLELMRQLQRHGVEVFINRTAWEGIALSDYFKKAAAMKPDAGISVHSNSAAGTSAAGTAKGFEAFRQTNSFSSKSAELCKIIEAEVKELGQSSRGIKVHFKQSVNNYINSVPAPYAYCELGFIDNPADYAQFNTEAKQKAFGTAYAKGILIFLGIAWKDETPPAPQEVLYRVQAGAFKDRRNAENLQAQLKSKGFNSVIMKSTP